MEASYKSHGGNRALKPASWCSAGQALGLGLFGELIHCGALMLSDGHRSDASLHIQGNKCSSNTARGLALRAALHQTCPEASYRTSRDCQLCTK